LYHRDAGSYRSTASASYRALVKRI